MDTTETDSATPLLGRLLDGRYRLDSLIARGGMATVFQATDTRLDRTVAVKVMHGVLAQDPDFVARFTREAKASARVQAPEVVAVHDQGTDPGTGLAYLVMEHVRGRNLRHLLQERGTLTPVQATELFEPVLRALAAAHSAGLVHRDVKPENVLVADDGRVKVADFGLARAVEGSALTQTTSNILGTLAYVAPEYVERGASDARTDVYSAGIVLWEMLVGAPPHGSEVPTTLMYKHVHEDVPAPSTAVAGIPPALDELVVRATRRDPDERYADAGELLTALQEVRRGLPADPLSVQPLGDQRTLVVPRTPPTKPPLKQAQPQPTGQQPKAPRPRRRRRWVVALVVLLALSLSALGTGYYLGSYRYTKAPSVLALSLAEAKDKLQRAGLSAKEGPAQFSETVPPGEVLAQKPRGGERIRKNGTITLVLSRGPDRRAVPDVVGKDVPTATRALQAAGLVVAANVTYEYSQGVAKDLVIRTLPGSGTKLKPGTAIRLVVSKGREPVDVPNLTGKPQDEAQRTLEALGFKVGVVQQFSDTVAKGIVLSQSPDHGTADRGSTVTLTVSKGPDVVVVPDVTGKSRDDAQSQLEALGLKVRVRSFPNGPGRVLSQDPPSGTTVRRGAQVTIYVY